MNIGFCLECSPPRILAAGTQVKELKSHAFPDGTVHRKTKTVTVAYEPRRLAEGPQQYLDRLTEKFSAMLTE